MIVTVKDLSSDHKLLFVHEINCLLFRTNISLCFALVCQMIKNSTKFVVVYISLKQILRRSEYCWSYFDNCFHWKAWRTINCHSCGTKEMSFHFEMQLISGWGFIKNIRNGKVKVKLLSRVWLCDPMDYSLTGFSIHGIFQARVLEWVVISFSRGSSWPRDWTQVSHIAGRCFTLWATREAVRNGKLASNDQHFI